MNKLIRAIQIPITMALLIILGLVILVAGVVTLLLGAITGAFCLAFVLLTDTL